MLRIFWNDTKYPVRLCTILFCLVFFASCLPPIVRKAPKDRPFLYKNSIEVKGGKFTNTEKTALKQRLNSQLDDSSTIKTKDKYIFLHYITQPPAYDTGYSGLSARNMKSSMFHIGYYHANVSYRADTSHRKVHVTYTVDAGPPTLIDTVRYLLRKPGLQEIALNGKNESLLVEKRPISKSAILAEINRLVDSFRNNGYYKFTAAELRVRGDTTIAALTTVSDDPFEQLRLLAEAQEQKDSPQIKLAVVLVPPTDSSKLNKFYINKVYVLSDYRQSDNFTDTININQRANRNFIERYHERLFRTGFLVRSLTLKPGELFRQANYYSTLNNLSKVAVWQSVNIQLVEIPGDSNKIDVIVELIPNKKLGFQASLEASYSASTNSSSVVSGNLFGISGNLLLLNRNLAKEGIRMTHNIRAGIELNNSTRGQKGQLINSNELGYTNTIAMPRVVFPDIKNWFRKREDKRPKKQISGETFINTDFSYNNRLNLFNLQSTNLNFGYTLATKKPVKRPRWNWTVRPFFLGFSNLFNETDSFKTILKDNPFLRYSYNTAFVLGTGVGVSKFYSNPWHPHSRLKERSININGEESGLTWGAIPILARYKRRYVKGDIEYKYSVSYQKTVLAVRLFGGVGIPLLGSDTNRTLPFFKQYFGGGSNSMRGWPVRGIGPGGKPLTAFNSTRIFNDRTGDMRLEANLEYRYDIARIIPNALTLRGAIFVDAGNIWNLRNTKLDGSIDSTQFMFKNIYKQLGVSAGTGFRLDFNYLVLRFDLGFRFKRPELYYINDGWKAPPVGFDDVLKKIFARGRNDEYRKWRYENFNFTIGIGYAF
ncbi:MAG: BamA/TamA family outer membrane protein [Ferruginibacter sp.]